jgi:hypothetical protein
MAHVFPFQRSARARALRSGGSLPPVLPAATHTPAAGHDTDASCPGPGLRTGGERCITHAVPSWRSITGGPEPAWPTAVQAAAGEQPTAFSRTPPAPGTAGGVRWPAHRTPFQRPASASSRTPRGAM